MLLLVREFSLSSVVCFSSFVGKKPERDILHLHAIRSDRYYLRATVQVLGTEEDEEVDDESTGRQINLFKSVTDEIDIISESELLRTKICSFLTQTL